MAAQSSIHPKPDGQQSPMADPSRWAELIEGVRPEAFLFLLGLKNAAQVLQPTRESKKRERFIDHMDIGSDAAL